MHQGNRPVALSAMAFLGVALAGMAGGFDRLDVSSAPPKQKRQKAKPAPKRARASKPFPFHPTINRWTGEPHQHAREIARRQRQAAR